nr:uncharacterized protein LOC121126852 isoform X1 [Lepeophtheirus salmonis]
MLIGGVHCRKKECIYSYSRYKNASGKFYYANQKIELPHFDNNIMFYTKYGFCRRPSNTYYNIKPYTLPKMPVHIAGAGAVALPDGRVIICGGQIGTYNKLTRIVEVRDNVKCWYWLYNDIQIRELQFQNKPPFHWLGSMNKVMHGISLENYSKENQIYSYLKETYQVIRYLKKFRDEKKNFYLDDFYRNYQKYFIDILAKMRAISEDYHIIIIPWAPHSSIYISKIFKHITKALKIGSEILEGQVIDNKFGPGINWKRNYVSKFLFGFGGCTTITKCNKKGVAILFGMGGQEMQMNIFHSNKSDSSKLPSDITKYLRGARIQKFREHDQQDFNLRFRPINKYGLLMANISNSRFMSENLKHYMLNEDRTFSTCHTLQGNELLKINRSKVEIIMIGGGSITFFDRQRLKRIVGIHRNHNTNVSYLHQNIYAYSITEIDPWVKGMKIQNHRGYLFGLNFPRSRHSSEIIRIKGKKNGEYFRRIVVIGGYCAACKDIKGNKGTTLDIIEEMNMYSDKPDHFRIQSGFKKRLPWPMMDITTVKIPVEWLPPQCYVDYYVNDLRHESKSKITFNVNEGLKEVFDYFRFF